MAARILTTRRFHCSKFYSAFINPNPNPNPFNFASHHFSHSFPNTNDPNSNSSNSSNSSSSNSDWNRNSSNSSNSSSSNSDWNWNSSNSDAHSEYLKVSGWKYILSLLENPIPNTINDGDDPTLVDTDDSFEICSPAHDVCCLTNSGREIILFNITNREFLRLPPSLFPFTQTKFGKFWAYKIYPIGVGFGLDPKTKLFKLIRVVSFCTPRHYYPPRVEVFDFDTGRWREIRTPMPGHGFVTFEFQLCYQEFMYCWALEYDKLMLLSYDMSKETFRLIPLLESFRKDRAIHLEVWNGKVVLFHYSDIKKKKTFDIWAMETDESGGVSWSKLLTVGPVPLGISRPLLFLNSNELLLITEDELVISYNVNTKEFKDLGMKWQLELSKYFAFGKSVEVGSWHDIGAAY